MHRSSVSEIKRAQKESLFLKEISTLMNEAARDDIHLREAFITRVSLSDDGSFCTLFFYADKGEAYFKEHVFPYLVVYKPSLRKALASRISSRYTPDVHFRFDDKFEKMQRIESILDAVAEDQSEE
jgi:ribosome-binding factor A